MEPDPAPMLPPPPSFDFSPLTEFIQTSLDSIEMADSAALILLQDGRVIYERGFGSMTTDTEVPIASAAKWLSATTLLTAVEQGDIELDELIDQHLPPEWLEGKGTSQGKHFITFRHLISLTSGVITHHPCIYRSQRTLQSCTLDIGGRQTVAPPGEAFVYSQAAFTVAGAALENATGMSWAEIFDRNMRGPLGLDQTHYLGVEWGNPQLGDGATSSVRNYARMVQMIANGGVLDGQRVLSSELVEEMLRSQRGFAQVILTPRRPEITYGLGVWRDRVDPVTDEALLVSSPGSRGFIPWIDFERNLVGVLAIPPHLTFTSPIWGGVWARVREIVPAQP